MACGHASDAIELWIYLYNLIATMNSLNSTSCHVSHYGTVFGSTSSLGSFSGLYLTVYNCSDGSIVEAIWIAVQATVGSSTFFRNSVSELESFAWGILAADYDASHVSQAMSVSACIFSGNSPPGYSIVRLAATGVAKFLVANSAFSDFLPPSRDADLSRSTVIATAAHALRMANASICLPSACPTRSSSPLATATRSPAVIQTRSFLFCFVLFCL
jgi:hypothetical protein